MSLSNPQSTIKLFNVPWGKNDKNFKMFDSRDIQTSRFLDYIETQTVKYEGTEFNIVKNGVIKIPVCAYNVNKYNYMMFSNPDVTSSRTYWYAFIDRVEWGSYNTAHVYYTLDAWQNYQFDITYKDCFIERMHISKAEDNTNFYDYTAPEPVGFPASVGTEITTVTPSEDSQKWWPAWMLNTVSTFGAGTGSTIPFYYGGYNVGTSTATGGYSFPLSKFGGGLSIENFLAVYRDTALFQSSHLDEIINLTCVPEWCEDDGDIGLDTHCEEHVYKSNKTCQYYVDVSGYQSEVLACGYAPRNKKLFTSLAKLFMVKNSNGLTIPLKPELFDLSGVSKKPRFLYNMMPIHCNSIKAIITNYKSPDCYFDIPYGASLSIGFNSNQGIAGFMNKLTAIGSLGIQAGNTGVQFASGNVLGGIGGALNTVQAFGNAVNAFDSVYKQAGSCTDIMSVNGGAIRPMYYDMSPTYEECEIIDNYLDVYGYAVNKRMNPTDAMSTRPAWNYIKVTKLDAKINAPDDMASVIRSAFESGCHIWHGYIQNVGDFSGNNS